ncbi:hypothetical protein HYT84_01225 [Candidatus Micrarchaeota archaeon]|nr:hypothetical protein [Candidatus Micrarchaeota archaeon]
MENSKKLIFALIISLGVIAGLTLFNLFGMNINRIPLLMVAPLLALIFLEELKQLHYVVLTVIVAIIIALLMHPLPSFVLLGSSGVIFPVLFIIPYIAIKLREKIFKQPTS